MNLIRYKLSLHTRPTIPTNGLFPPCGQASCITIRDQERLQKCTGVRTVRSTPDRRAIRTGGWRDPCTDTKF